MKELNEFFSMIDANIGGSPWFVIALLSVGVFFTIYLKFPQIRFFKHSLQVISGKFDKKDSKGDITHFQSLVTALSGTVGTGNIAGVALAIHLGGPAALFWMLVTAVVGMTTKMVEVSLSLKYREKLPDGTMSGGPMYYMKKRLNMGWLAAIFAVCAIFTSFGMGAFPQTNSISTSVFAMLDVPHWITGLVMMVLLALIIMGGIKRIAKINDKLIPFMAFIYIGAAICVLISNSENIIPAIKSIFSDIFTGTAATGGFLGANIVWAINRGVNRGLFSNEAGMGSSAMAHSAAKTQEPVSEGIVALLEPFVDTVIICMLTGVVLLSSGVWNEKFENQFQLADLEIVDGIHRESDADSKNHIANYIADQPSQVVPYDGSLDVLDGKIVSDVTILHARSFADNVVLLENTKPFTGSIEVRDGRVVDSRLSMGDIVIVGESLVHSAVLSTQAFQRTFFGKWGGYVVPFSLILFAFSTALTWYYYGSRAVHYLGGGKYIVIFQITYLVGVFFASFADTSIVWTISGIATALMTLPNLVGMILLRKEVKQDVVEYWSRYKNR